MKIRKYASLDKIIEIALTVAEDASSAVELEQTPDVGEVQIARTEIAEQPQISDTRVPYSPTPGDTLGRIREQIVSALSLKYSQFVKKSRALYWTADKSARAAITISKEYASGNFWYAYHPDWGEFLSEGSVGLFGILSCRIGSFSPLLTDGSNQTERRRPRFCRRSQERTYKRS